MTQENIWKKFPEKPLRKNIFSWVSTHEIYLELVSGKSSESRPKIAKSGKSFRDIPCVTARLLENIVKKSMVRILPYRSIQYYHGKPTPAGSPPKITKSGKSFRDIPSVTARFLEIVSGICLYGLN